MFLPSEKTMSNSKKNKIEAIVNLILKGVKNNKITEEDKTEFKKTYGEIIEKILGLKLRSNPIEAAMVSCDIAYSHEKVCQFGTNFKENKFEGLDDPSCLMWLYLCRNLKYKSSLKIYAVALTACRAFCQGRKIKRIDPSKTDVFIWKPSPKPTVAAPVG